MVVVRHLYYRILIFWGWRQLVSEWVCDWVSQSVSKWVRERVTYGDATSYFAWRLFSGQLERFRDLGSTFFFSSDTVSSFTWFEQWSLLLSSLAPTPLFSHDKSKKNKYLSSRRLYKLLAKISGHAVHSVQEKLCLWSENFQNFATSTSAWLLLFVKKMFSQ